MTSLFSLQIFPFPVCKHCLDYKEREEKNRKVRKEGRERGKSTDVDPALLHIKINFAMHM